MWICQRPRRQKWARHIRNLGVRSGNAPHPRATSMLYFYGAFVNAARPLSTIRRPRSSGQQPPVVGGTESSFTSFPAFVANESGVLFWTPCGSNLPRCCWLSIHGTMTTPPSHTAARSHQLKGQHDAGFCHIAVATGPDGSPSQKQQNVTALPRKVLYSSQPTFNR